MVRRGRATRVRSDPAVVRSIVRLEHAEEDDDSGVDPQDPVDPESPDLQSGG